MLKSQTLFLNNIGAPFNRDIMQATHIGLNVLVATLKRIKKKRETGETNVSASLNPIYPNILSM